MPVEVKTIENLEFFKGLAYDELEEFASYLNPRNVAKNEALLREGTPALTFFIVLSGRYKVSLKGGKSYALARKGTVIGWSTVIGPFQYTGTATAETEGSVLYISSQEFFRLIQNNNLLGEKIMRKINKIAADRRALVSDEAS